jgi:hypothetical protein
VLFLWRRLLVLFLVTTRLAHLRLVPMLASWTRCGPRRFFVWRRYLVLLL